MEATKPAVSLLFALCLTGCKAQPTEQRDAAVYDLSRSEDFAGVDLTGEGDLASSDLRCPIGSAEICGNGCDDDGNGLVDDEDPACAPHVMATWEGGSTTLTHLALVPPYRTFTLDGNSVPPAAHAVYVRAFAPGVAFVAYDGATMQLDRITLAPGGAPGSVEHINSSYLTRDVCVFNGELIVVEPGTSLMEGKLHRLAADGKTENGFVQPVAWPSNMHLSACASDGQHLYVAEHVGTMPTQFEELDTSFMPVASPAPIPDQLLNAGLDRCVDFAFARGQLYGLFADSGGLLKDELTPTELHAFTFDGGVGPAIDAGALRGLGEYLP